MSEQPVGRQPNGPNMRRLVDRADHVLSTDLDGRRAAIERLRGIAADAAAMADAWEAFDVPGMARHYPPLLREARRLAYSADLMDRVIERTQRRDADLS